MNRYIVMQRTESVVKPLPRETEISEWSQFAMVRTSSPPEDVLRILTEEEDRHLRLAGDSVCRSFLVIPWFPEFGDIKSGFAVSVLEGKGGLVRQVWLCVRKDDVGAASRALFLGWKKGGPVPQRFEFMDYGSLPACGIDSVDEWLIRAAPVCFEVLPHQAH